MSDNVLVYITKEHTWRSQNHSYLNTLSSLSSTCATFRINSLFFMINGIKFQTFVHSPATDG